MVVFSLERGGGARRMAAEVGSSLSKRGHDVTFLTFFDDENTYDVEGDVISLKDDSNYSYPLEYTIHNFKRGKKISNICKNKEINTVLSFSFAANYSSVLSKVLFQNKSKIVISQRNNPLMKHMDFYHKFIKKRIFPKSDIIVTLSRGVEDILNSDFSIHNTKTIYNPYSMERFWKLGKDSVNDNHEKLFDQDFIFINIGRLEKQKGQWHLLRAFKKVQEKNKDSKLIILGQGSLRKELENLVNKLGLEDSVFLLGVVDNVFPYLRKSDCFVFPSLYEGFGNAQIEALSQNLPVISADCVAGPRDILCPELEMDEEVDYPYYGEYGILSKPFDQNMSFGSIDEKTLDEKEKTLAHAMMKVMKNERLRERYSNGVERVKDFDYEEIMDQWEEVI